LLDKEKNSLCKMSNKRKREESTAATETTNNERREETACKRWRPLSNELMLEKLKRDYQILSEHLANRNENETQLALDYFKSIFPSQLDSDLPEIVHLSQIYALVKSKTQVDRDIENLRAQKVIILFNFDSNNQTETLICFYQEYKRYVCQRTPTAAKNLVDLYLNSIISNEANQLSINKQILLSRYKLEESHISSLVHIGLLAIKEPGIFWFSIPGIGKFRLQLQDSRRSLLDILRRQKYKEMNIKLFFDFLLINKNKKFKSVNRIGADYVLCDLIGSDLIHTFDSPLGLHIRLANSS
jgi:serine/threonine-protein kinase 19